MLCKAVKDPEDDHDCGGTFFVFFMFFFSFRDVIRSIKSSKKNRTIITERKIMSQNLEKKIMSLINIVT